MEELKDLLERKKQVDEHGWSDPSMRKQWDSDALEWLIRTAAGSLAIAQINSRSLRHDIKKVEGQL
jgi:hypothetical protein